MHLNALLYAPAFPVAARFFILIIAVWTIVIKGFALWYAARANQRWWFIALLVINTLGLLEIAYLIWFRPDHHKNKMPPMNPTGPSSALPAQ